MLVAWKEEPARRKQLIIINFIKVRSGQFFNQQEEDLNQKLPRAKNRFVFNNLAVHNAG